MSSINDPLLIFKGPLNKDVPKSFIPYINTIRNQSQWKTLNFKVKHDDLGNYESIEQNGLFFRFNKILKIDELVRVAVQSGKIYETYPPNIFHHINLFGCTFDDFAYISEDAKAYCNARLHLQNNDLQKAYTFIQEAIILTTVNSPLN